MGQTTSPSLVTLGPHSAIVLSLFLVYMQHDRAATMLFGTSLTVSWLDGVVRVLESYRNRDLPRLQFEAMDTHPWRVGRVILSTFEHRSMIPTLRRLESLKATAVSFLAWDKAFKSDLDTAGVWRVGSIGGFLISREGDNGSEFAPQLEYNRCSSSGEMRAYTSVGTPLTVSVAGTLSCGASTQSR